MKVTITALLLLLNSFLFSQTSNKKSEPEAKSVFKVQIDSNTYILEEGNEINIDGGLIDPKITIELLDIKKLNIPSMSFDFPRNFSFEVEKSEGYKNWTLDGNDFVIMIFDIDGESQVKNFTDNMMSQFEKENCTTIVIETKLGRKDINGIRLRVDLIGQQLTIDFYEYSNSENNSKYIAFQD